MKKLFTIILLFCAHLITYFTAQAQNCRYNDPVFNEITITQNVQYGTNTTIGGAEKVLKFDFYEPKNDALTLRPLVIMAHGGSFVAGDENSPDIVSIAKDLAQRGYCVASINYRLIDGLPQFPLDQFMMKGASLAIFDMKAAIRFFRKDAANDNLYKIDPNYIFIGGASAGAITAVHAAYLSADDNIPTFLTDFIALNGGLEGNSGNDGYPSNVSGVINLCGAIKDTAWIQKNEPPIMSEHGDNDGTVAYGKGFAVVSGIPIVELDGSYVIHQKTNQLGMNSFLRTIPNGEHMAHAMPENAPQTLNDIISFLYPLLNTNEPQCTPLAVPQITNNLNNTNLTLYPNPTTQTTLITLNNPNHTPIQNVKIISLQGQVLSEIKTTNNNTTLQIPTQNLPAGAYQLLISTPTQIIQKTLLIQ